MDKFESMKAFTRVVEAGGFAAAAREMGVTRSTVNKLVINLEGHLQTQLLQRTTRKVSPTDAGRAFYIRCVNILADVQDAELALSQLDDNPKGTLRVNAPMTFGTLHLAPILSEFMVQYPDIQVELSLNDRMIDPIEEGFDVTLRIAIAPTSASLVVEDLATSPLVLCAAPSYLDRAGTPLHPQDLRHHACLHYGYMSQQRMWSLIGPDQSYQVGVKGPLCCNNGEVLCEAAIAGLGLVILPKFIVSEALEQGLLIPVLEAYQPGILKICALYPVNRRLSTKVTVWTEFLKQKLMARLN